MVPISCKASYIYMHSVYFCQMVVNASFYMTMLLWKQYVLSYSPCHNNQHAEGVGMVVEGSILHNTIKIIIKPSGQVQCNVSQWRVPTEQLGHQGKAGSLISLSSAGNWPEARDGLFSCNSSDISSFTFTEPASEFSMSKCLLTKSGDQLHPSNF